MGTIAGALASARARWALMLLDLRKKGFAGEQLLPFPESLSEAKKRFELVKRYLLLHPESFDNRGLWDEYRLRLDEVMGYYVQNARDRAQRGLLVAILAFSLIAALAGVAGAIGAQRVLGWAQAAVQLIRALL